ncbi:hypothetical protein NDU88_001144 [Pleurodeles waltl]|uniref:Uncharacterized protein n=1 Tax=Pleurodeles waltl TaxID=8319 RepID=A0AAV7U6Q6_PLEWA|nr:hypothetical protein NDU88_001144 [Pleurodeles waltl]
MRGCTWEETHSGMRRPTKALLGRFKERQSDEDIYIYFPVTGCLSPWLHIKTPNPTAHTPGARLRGALTRKGNPIRISGDRREKETKDGTHRSDGTRSGAWRARKQFGC